MEESLEKEGQKDQSWAGKMGLSFLNLREQDGQIFSMRADQEREQIQALRKNRYTYDNVKRIMIRNVVILVDLSRAMREKDIPFDIQREDHESAPPDASNFNSLPTEEDDINPILHRNERDFLLTRLDLTLRCLRLFIAEFFRQNPLSRIGIVGMVDCRPTLLRNLTSSEALCKAALLQPIHAEGAISLQSGLVTAKTLFETVESEGSKEIICVLGSISTCDLDLFEAIQTFRGKVRVSVVSMSGEVRAFKEITKMTEGNYYVISRASEMKAIFETYCLPPPLDWKQKQLNERVHMLRIGFPDKAPSNAPSLCVCHEAFRYGGYNCVQCGSKYCQLPDKCRICGILLLTSTHIARCYRHLFPVPEFPTMRDSDIERIGTRIPLRCYSCNLNLGRGPIEMCKDCRNMFCGNCDEFIHEHLHNCPGCN